MDRINWHRLFGLLLTDFFAGSPFVVELEKDLSVKQQFLDVVILRKGKGQFPGRLPDGLDNLATHNLITFKSHQETLDDWALKELTGHYVNYRKQVSPALEKLLPEEEFRLYAVCSRYPHNLAGVAVWQPLQEGVYECRRGTDVIRVVVLGQLPAQKHNAALHLLSAKPELVQFGVANYQQHSTSTSTVLFQLFESSKREGTAMPYTMQDFLRDFAKEHFTPAQRRQGLSPEQWVKDQAIDEYLKGVSTEEIERELLRRKQEKSSRKRGKKK